MDRASKLAWGMEVVVWYYSCIRKAYFDAAPPAGLATLVLARDTDHVRQLTAAATHSHLRGGLLVGYSIEENSVGPGFIVACMQRASNGMVYLPIASLLLLGARGKRQDI